jgi:hypothetical protein
MGQNEVQKNKLTPYCLTEFHGESEDNNRFSPMELSFWSNTVSKKTSLNKLTNIKTKIAKIIVK